MKLGGVDVSWLRFGGVGSVPDAERYRWGTVLRHTPTSGDDRLMVCLRDADGAYAWVPLVGAGGKSEIRLSEYGILPDTGDDLTADIQAVIDDHAGRTILFDRPGVYLVTTPTTAGGISWYLAVDTSHTTIAGVPGAVLKTTVSTKAALIRMHGAFKPGGRNAISTHGLPDATTYAMAAASKNDTSVTLTDPADAANFAAGDWVYLRTGQLVGASTEQPDAEINRVAEGWTDAEDGVITLQYPLAKAYAQEYFLSGTSGQTSTTVTANAATFGIANVTDRIIEDVAVRGLTLHNLAMDSGGSLVVQGEAVGAEITDCVLITSMHAHGGGTHKDFKMLRCRVWMQNTDDRYWVAPSTGCTDIEIAHNRVVADTLAYLHIHEGVARANAHDNEMVIGSGGIGNYIDLRTRAYDIQITNNYLSTTGSRVPVFIDATCTGGGIISGNTFDVPNNPFGISCAASNWIIEGNRPTTLPVNQLASATALDTGELPLPEGPSPLQQYVSAAFVTSDLTNPTIVPLPPYVVVDSVRVDVTEAFNSDGTDAITVGTDADTDAFGVSVDVSITGLKTVTAGVKLGRYQSAAQTVEAYYTAGGSDPTTGKALVEVTWHRTAREVV